jgi:hypothetical protein
MQYKGVTQPCLIETMQLVTKNASFIETFKIIMNEEIQPPVTKKISQH